MSVTDLHPDELLDRDLRGELTSAEQDFLAAHLVKCATCRFERQVRADFMTEIDAPLPMHDGALVLKALEHTKAAQPTREEDARKTETNAELEIDDSAEKPVRIDLKRRRLARAAMTAVAAAVMLASAVVAAREAKIFPQVFGVATHARDVEEATTSAPHSAATTTRATQNAKDAPSNTNDAPKDDSPVAPEPAPVIQEAPSPIVPVMAPASQSKLNPNVKMTSYTTTRVEQGHAPSAPSTVSAPAAPIVGSAIANGNINGNAIATNAASASNDPQAMFDRANEARRRGDHGIATQLYRDLISSHGDTREAHAARVTLGRLLLDDGDARGALSMFSEYARDGGGPLDEEALVGKARALDRLGRVGEARDAWTDVANRYPQSVHAEHARARMKELEGR